MLDKHRRKSMRKRSRAIWRSFRECKHVWGWIKERRNGHDSSPNAQVIREPGKRSAIQAQRSTIGLLGGTNGESKSLPVSRLYTCPFPLRPFPGVLCSRRGWRVGFSRARGVGLRLPTPSVTLFASRRSWGYRTGTIHKHLFQLT